MKLFLKNWKKSNIYLPEKGNLSLKLRDISEINLDFFLHFYLPSLIGFNTFKRWERMKLHSTTRFQWSNTFALEVSCTVTLPHYEASTMISIVEIFVHANKELLKESYKGNRQIRKLRYSWYNTYWRPSIALMDKSHLPTVNKC